MCYVIMIDISGTIRQLVALDKEDKVTLKLGKLFVMGKGQVRRQGGVGSETIGGETKDEDNQEKKSKVYIHSNMSSKERHGPNKVVRIP